MISPVTYLFVPADRPERFKKALTSGADRVIIDLEDAVRPEAKPAARESLALAVVNWSSVVVRINDAASPYWFDDLAALTQMPVEAVMLPKAEREEDITAVLAAAGRAIEIIPQIETVRGLVALDALLSAPGVNRVAFGHLDFALDLGAAADWESLLMIRSKLVFRSRLSGRAAPIDSVSPDIANEDGLLRDAEAGRRLGFGGKLLIHPRQIGVVQRAYSPSAAEIAWAERVIAATSGGAGAVSVDGHMVDKPVEDAARRILAISGIVS